MKIALFVTCCALGTANAATTSFRCRNDLVNVGDNKASVLTKCGEPVARDSFCKAQTTPPGQRTPIVVPCETVETMTYNPGYGQLMTTLRFESGTLKAIEYGDRVK